MSDNPTRDAGMHIEFYNLKASPFQLTPDPRFFFGSTVHNRAMAHLTFGLEQGEGFIVITGDVGAGKTTLVGHLLSTLTEDYVSGMIVTTHLNGDDMLRMVTSAFGIQTESVDKASLLRRLEDFLRTSHQNGKRVLLIVDEAQNLSIHAVEELRMLSNLQVGDASPLQSFLLGQPQFKRTLASPDLEQLRQRVIVSYHLGPLSQRETRAYIEHRLSLAGWQQDPVFTEDAFKSIYAHTGGLPRKINVLCSRLLLFGFLEELHEIDGAAVEQVADEYESETELAEEVPDHRPVEERAPSANGHAEILERLDALDRHVKLHDSIIKKSLRIAADLLDGARNR